MVDNLPLQNGDHQSVTAIVALLEKHMKGHTNIVLEHRNFLCRQQQVGERFDDILTASRFVQKLQFLLALSRDAAEGQDRDRYARYGGGTTLTGGKELNLGGCNPYVPVRGGG